MQKLLVMTDLHICRPGEKVIGLDPATRFRAVLEAALAAHGDAAALILMGDLTHRGLPEEYAALADILAAVLLPIIPMLGNHDRREAFLDAFPDAPRTDDGFVQAILDLPTHRIITLDSLDGPPYRAGHHAGRLVPSQIAFLENALNTAEGRAPLVVVHHPPFETGIVSMDRINLADGAALLDLLATHPGTHLICGHLHRTISGSARGVPWAVLKSPCHQGVLDLTSDNSALSVDEPGAYGVVLLSTDGVAIHSEDVMATPATLHSDYGLTS